MGSSDVGERGAAVAIAPRSSATTRPVAPISLVTTVWGRYEQYVDQWNEAVEALTVKPAEVIIHRPKDKVPGMGKARNDAIAKTTQPWVLHMDIDDVILPDALAQSVPLFDIADVIVWNFWQVNASGRRFVKYIPISLASYRGAAVAPSNSPFRRTFWERSPYLEIKGTQKGLHGAVDTFLWAGFAKLGARFVNLTGAQFDRTYHADSVSNEVVTQDENWSRVTFHRMLTETERPADFPDHSTRLMPVPQWVRTEAMEEARKLGIPAHLLIEHAWRIAKAEKSSTAGLKPQVSGAD